jgi:hypothetical protein
MSNATQNVRSHAVRSEQNREECGATSDLVCHLKEYAAENPTTAALWCLGIGFFLGWKLRIW